MATIKHLVIPLLLTTLLICRKERQFDKKNKTKWTRIHPIAAPKMGFSATHLWKSQANGISGIIMRNLYSAWQFAFT